MYYLRSEARKRKLCPCYLQEYLQGAKLCNAISPKVCLTRLEVLDKYNKNRFYVKNDEIIPILRTKEKLSYEKNFWKMFCILVLITVPCIYWKEDFSKYGIPILIRNSFIKHTFQNRQYEAIKFYIKDLLGDTLLNTKKDDEIAKPASFMSETCNENEFDPVEIRNIVREYLAEQKRNKNIHKPREGFVKEQCWKDPHSGVPELFGGHKNESHKAESSDWSNQTDYALESQGATVVSVFDTKPYGIIAMKIWNYDVAAVVNYLTQKFIVFNGPSSVLTSWRKPGDCWAFKGSRGRIEIKLSKKIFINAISVDHITKDLTPDGVISSAPKKLSVAGLEQSGNPNSKTYLGTYEYKISGPSRQVFKIEPPVFKSFDAVEVTIDSNHGNKDYTCVYKIGVHTAAH